jgi:DNA processing protein
LSLARELAAFLAKEKISVLSGGALGIDAAAHGGAIDAGGRTAVVLPSGFDHLYPMRHGPLYESIIAGGGALVSPFPPDTPPARWTFPRRNALLAALCDLLVVVQAPPGSGSLITAEAARRLGRRVLVVPASPGDPRGGGCIKLLRMGCEVCAVPADVMTALAHRDGPLQAYAHTREPVRERPPRESRTRTRTGDARAHARVESTTHARTQAQTAADAQAWTLDDESRTVYDSLASEPRHIDEIANKASFPAARVRSALLTLVLLGIASDMGNGSFTRSG